MTTRRRGPAKTPVLAAGAEVQSKAYRNHILTIGPVPIPISIVSSVMTPAGLRQQYVKEDGEYFAVGMRPYNKVTGQNIDDPNTIIKGVQTEDGVVELTTDDMKLGSDKACKIVSFIDLTTLSPAEHRLICPTKFYQIRPQPIKVGRESRPNKEATQILSLLLTEMEAAGVHAIVMITMNEDEPVKMGLMDWGAQLRLLSYQDFIREEPPMAPMEHSAKDRQLAGRLIKQMMVGYMPANPDGSREHLERVLKTKKAGGPLIEPTNGGLPVDGLPRTDLMAIFQAAVDLNLQKGQKAKA